MGTTKIAWTENTKKRFWDKVDMSLKDLGCWDWTAGLFSNGYGQFRKGNLKLKAHRVAYMITFGSIPSGKLVCHHCDNKRCVNPSHLFIGTHKDNAQDREKKGRHPHKGVQRFGVKNSAAKIDPTIVKFIRRCVRSGNSYLITQRVVIAYYDVKISKSQIANIVHRRSWSNVK